MVEIILSFAWLAVVCWLIARAIGQRGALPELSPSSADDGDGLPDLCFIVPARDESANIGRCLRSLLSQSYPRDRLRVVVIDDDSGDDTAAIVMSIAAEDPRVTLIPAARLPLGWKGKVNACWSGVNAVPRSVSWLCFMDADMWADPLLAVSAVRSAIEEDLDLLSLTPRHELKSLAERLMIPCGLYLLAFSQDLQKVQAPDSGEASATGQFMLMRRRAYDAVGGHAAVRTAICEDLELARLIKRSGYRVLLKDGSRILNTRMYTGWDTLWPGIAKNLCDMLGGRARTAVIAVLAVALAAASVALPAMDLAGAIAGSTLALIALGPALLGSAAAFALHIAGAIHFRIPFWYGLLFPVGYAAGAAMGIDSLRWRATRRIRWKGRVYQ